MDDGKIVADGTPETVFADVSGMRGLGLDVPAATEISFRLREMGLKIPLVLTPAALADALRGVKCS
ncbi:hypothetical protein FACS189490_09750 [Clostridia bacterium]|nr:hypothetical protein FACS189490_09750 [Clostridia bacterium]